jgi:hypothetical protein
VCGSITTVHTAVISTWMLVCRTMVSASGLSLSTASKVMIAIVHLIVWLMMDGVAMETEQINDGPTWH